MGAQEHYLKVELYERVRNEPAIFDFLQAGSLDGIWYWDIENPEHEWYSDRFATTLGYEPHEVPNKSDWWQQHIYEDDLTSALHAFEQHRENPGCPYDVVVRYRHKDGSTVWIRCRGLLIRDSDGTPLRMLGAHTDVTAIKKGEQDAVARLKLERSNRELESFARILAHDLRQPLRNVSTYLGLLEQELGDETPEAASNFLGNARDSVKAMTRMIGDILQLARIGFDNAGFTPCDLNAIVEEARRSIDLGDEHIDVEPLPTVMGDGGQLARVFQNLLDNAVKYADPTRPLLVQIRSPQPNVVTIQDNGQGFDNRSGHHIFTLFHRLDPTASEGSGIGLSVVKKVIQLHGGSIRADGALGRGATFTIEFPDS